MDFRKNIDTFLLNEMDEEQKVLFVREMERDLDFAADVEFQKKIMDASKANTELKERIAKIAKEEKKKKGLKYIFAGLLLITMIAVVSVWYSQDKKTEVPLFAMEEILNVNYEHKSFTIKGTDNNEVKEKLKDDIAESFNKKEYANALIILDSLEQMTSLDNELKMLKGNCFYETSAFDEALVTFNDFIENGTRGERIYAKYYSVLVYLKEDKNTDSYKILVDEIIVEVEETGFDFEFIEEVRFLNDLNF